MADERYCSQIVVEVDYEQTDAGSQISQLMAEADFDQTDAGSQISQIMAEVDFWLGVGGRRIQPPAKDNLIEVV